ncbi:MAG: hypothetical protein C4562_05675 [Actinobacteria bacterium]|nr:MAG: hypothetical protein C4562_05675 [Actinomycetota bacterium]
MSNIKIDAVVLAGGHVKSNRSDKLPKSSIKIGNQTALELVTSCLNGCPVVGDVIITSFPKEAAPLKGFTFIEDKGDLVENISLAIEKTTSDKVLLVAVDIPLITPGVIEEYVRLCLLKDAEADFYYPLIPKESMKDLIEMERTYFKVDGRLFTGGNVMLLSRDLFNNHRELAQQIYENRKSPLKLVELFGPKFLLKFALGKLRLSDAEAKLSQVLGAKAVAVELPLPEIGSDIDKQSDLDFINDYLEKSKANN